MDSEDDERSIDWAPTKIRLLENQIERMSENFTKKIDLLDERTTERFEAQSARINELTDRVNELQAAIASRVREELSAGFRELDPDEEFSPPIGGRAGDVVDHTHLRGTGQVARNGGLFALGSETPVVEAQPGGVVPEVSFKRGSIAAVFEASWERGYEAGRRAAVDEAQSRVGVVLDRSHIFNPATRLKIMNEIKAVLTTKPADDMPFQLELAEKRVIAKCVEMGWHPNSPAALGMVNALRGTKPIKDQPQG